MKIASLIVAMLLIPIGTAFSQSVAADTDAILQLERQWETALLSKDQTAIDQIVAADCVFVSSNGEVMTKAQADAENQITTLTKSMITEMQVRLFGDIAVVVGSNQESSLNRLWVTTGSYRWTDIFARRNGRWVVVSAQSTKIG